jgi:hypothetical protein
MTFASVQNLTFASVQNLQEKCDDITFLLDITFSRPLLHGVRGLPT